MKKQLFTLLVLLNALAAFGQNFGAKIDPSQGFTDRLKAASEKTQTITCDFEQIKYLSVLSNSNKSKGKFYYKKAQNFCLEYSIPQGNMIIMNGAKFKMVAGGKATIVGMKSNPMMRQMGGMLAACMTGNLSLLAKGALTEYYESGAHYTVIITPTNNRVKSHLRQIILQFEKKDMTLSMMKMSENETDYTLYEFREKRINVDVDDSKFKI